VAGFCIEVRQGGATPQSTLRLVDITQCTGSGTFHARDVTAVWLHAKQSRQRWIRRSADRLWFIEGAPDRLPRQGESLLEWLPGRWGSFRGFEICSSSPEAPAQVTVFVDPLCTRPIFYRVAADQLLFSDKLATLALNSADDAEVNWNAVLEAMLLGSVYKYHLTTLAAAEEVGPGETLVFRENHIIARYTNKLPEHEATSSEAIRRDPEGSLTQALRKAVQDCWTDHDAVLLLSGGLDSRAILALAGEGHKAVTIEKTASETALARRIAEACHAEFVALPYRQDEWLLRMQLGFWLANGTHDAEFINDVGLAERLAPLGIHAIAHGYLFDTILKGWLIRPLHQHADLSLTVLGQLGPAGKHFRDTSSRASFYSDRDLLGMLSKEGAQQAIKHLRETAASLTPVSDGRLDITFERHVLPWVSKQVHYGCYVSWMEALDLASPVFHPALWSWYWNSRAEDRYLGRAYRRALVGLNHPAFAVPDANTGAPICMPRERWTDKAQDQLWYRAARRLWRTVRQDKQPPFRDKRSDRFRSPKGRELFEIGVETLRNNPLFEAAAMERARDDFFAGNDRPFEPLMTLTGVAQWYDLVKRSKSYEAPQINTPGTEMESRPAAGS
jgi:Asparagine synthase